jgi:hypothetical protein
MWDASYPFFEWHNASWLGQQVSNSIWYFPAIETVHILAMAIMFGGLLVLNLRLLGLGMKHHPLPMLASTLMPFVNWGLIVMIISGYAMFASEALKAFSNDGFKFKMACLAAILVFQYTFYRAVIRQDDARRNKVLGGLAAIVSFALWFGVGAGGRAIGFV